MYSLERVFAVEGTSPVAKVEWFLQFQQQQADGVAAHLTQLRNASEALCESVAHPLEKERAVLEAARPVCPSLDSPQGRTKSATSVTEALGLVEEPNVTCETPPVELSTDVSSSSPSTHIEHENDDGDSSPYNRIHAQLLSSPLLEVATAASCVQDSSPSCIEWLSISSLRYTGGVFEFAEALAESHRTELGVFGQLADHVRDLSKQIEAEKIQRRSGEHQLVKSYRESEASLRLSKDSLRRSASKGEQEILQRERCRTRVMLSIASAAPPSLPNGFVANPKLLLADEVSQKEVDKLVWRGCVAFQKFVLSLQDYERSRTSFNATEGAIESHVNGVLAKMEGFSAKNMAMLRDVMHQIAAFHITVAKTLDTACVELTQRLASIPSPPPCVCDLEQITVGHTEHPVGTVVNDSSQLDLRLIEREHDLLFKVIGEIQKCSANSKRLLTLLRATSSALGSYCSTVNSADLRLPTSPYSRPCEELVTTVNIVASHIVARAIMVKCVIDRLIHSVELHSQKRDESVNHTIIEVNRIMGSLKLSSQQFLDDRKCGAIQTQESEQFEDFVSFHLNKIRHFKATVLTFDTIAALSWSTAARDEATRICSPLQGEEMLSMSGGSVCPRCCCFRRDYSSSSPSAPASPCTTPRSRSVQHSVATTWIRKVHNHKLRSSNGGVNDPNSANIDFPTSCLERFAAPTMNATEKSRTNELVQGLSELQSAVSQMTNSSRPLQHCTQPGGQASMKRFDRTVFNIFADFDSATTYQSWVISQTHSDNESHCDSHCDRKVDSSGCGAAGEPPDEKMKSGLSSLQPCLSSAASGSGSRDCSPEASPCGGQGVATAAGSDCEIPFFSLDNRLREGKQSFSDGRSHSFSSNPRVTVVVKRNLQITGLMDSQIPPLMKCEVERVKLRVICTSPFEGNGTHLRKGDVVAVTVPVGDIWHGYVEQRSLDGDPGIHSTSPTVVFPVSCVSLLQPMSEEEATAANRTVGNPIVEGYEFWIEEYEKQRVRISPRPSSIQEPQNGIMEKSDESETRESEGEIEADEISQSPKHIDTAALGRLGRRMSRPGMEPVATPQAGTRDGLNAGFFEPMIHQEQPSTRAERPRHSSESKVMFFSRLRSHSADISPSECQSSSQEKSTAGGGTGSEWLLLGPASDASVVANRHTRRSVTGIMGGAAGRSPSIGSVTQRYLQSSKSLTLNVLMGKGATSSVGDRGSSDEESDDEDDLISGLPEFYRENCNPDIPQLSAMNEEFRQRFDLLVGLSSAFSETVLQWFSCALSKKILLQGKVYLTERLLTFYSPFNDSTLFGESKIIVQLRNIAAINKKNSLGIIPNGLEIELEDGTIHAFSSFLYRDRAYDVIKLFSDYAKTDEQRQMQLDDGSTFQEPQLIGKVVSTRDDSNRLEGSLIGLDSGKAKVQALKSFSRRASHPQPYTAESLDPWYDAFSEGTAPPPEGIDTSLICREVETSDPLDEVDRIPRKCFPVVKSGVIWSLPIEKVFSILFDNYNSPAERSDGSTDHFYDEMLKLANSGEYVKPEWSPRPPPPFGNGDPRGPKPKRKNMYITGIKRNAMAAFLRFPAEAKLSENQILYVVNPKLVILQNCVDLHEVPFSDYFSVNVRFRLTAISQSETQLDGECWVDLKKSSLMNGKIETESLSQFDENWENHLRVGTEVLLKSTIGFDLTKRGIDTSNVSPDIDSSLIEGNDTDLHDQSKNTPVKCGIFVEPLKATMNLSLRGGSFIGESLLRVWKGSDVKYMLLAVGIVMMVYCFITTISLKQSVQETNEKLQAIQELIEQLSR